MNEYHKIQSIYKRDERGRFVLGDYAHLAFEYLRDKAWTWTEKVDGTNIRIHYRAGEIQFGGRTEAAQIPAKLLNYLKDHFTQERLLSVFPENLSGVTLYGEGFGAGIQKGGGNYSPDQRFVLFDVNCGGIWLERSNVKDVAQKLSIPAVPYLFDRTIEEAEKWVSAGFNSGWGPFQAEGLVGRPVVELFDRRGDRIVIKLKTKDYAALKVAA